ncbi:MAG: hypothetical protein K8S21_02240 [Gemmatimonadetes bacterium]|nr:hypothetical protein [Gemmatimonadota bacterium]
MPDHSAFGLRIRSSDPLPGLPLATTGEPDIVVRLGALPPWSTGTARVHRHSGEAEVGDTPTVTVWDLPEAAAIALRYAEGIRFSVTTDGRQVWADWDAPLTLDDAMTFLLGPVMGYALRRRGLLALHASAVVIAGRAIGIVGPGGTGKSTTATALVLRGHPLVTDDILVLRPILPGWETTPAIDQVRLWEDSERLLFGAASPMAALSPTWEKRGLAVASSGLRFQGTSVPLGGLLLLGPRSEEASAPRIESCGGAEAIIGLVANTYTNYLLDDVERAQELRAVGGLVRHVPVMRITPHADPERIGSLAGCVEEWAESLRGPRAG